MEYLKETILFLLGGDNPLYLSISGAFLIIVGLCADALKKASARKVSPAPEKPETNVSVADASATDLNVTDLYVAVDEQVAFVPQAEVFKTGVFETEVLKAGVLEEEDSDEEEEMPISLSDKLTKSRSSFLSGLRSFFSSGNNLSSFESKEWLTTFEELLIESDMGVRTSKKLISSVKENISSLSKANSPKEESFTADFIESSLKNTIGLILHSDELPEIYPQKVAGLPKVILVVGVNGAGKTTTIGKLAFQYQAQGAKVLIAACDTFRAAAANQLEVWKDRANAEIEKGADGEKPSTVAYRAIHRAHKENFDVLLVDTAGRLHTRANLMKELSGITSIISREQDGAPHETILVVDGSTGQNALQQAREFNEVSKLTGIIITKLDGTSKGGIVVAIKDELDIPIRYIGVGESVADLRPFEPEEFVSALFGSSVAAAPYEERCSG